MISWQHFVEFALNIFIRPFLKEPDQLQRFMGLRKEYENIYNLLSNSILKGFEIEAKRQDWDMRSKGIRHFLQKGVPLSFLAHPLITHTMVFQRRRGILKTREKINFIRKVFGEDLTGLLLKDDYLGLPTITSAKYMTSANRCYHINHLAHYATTCKKYFWECDIIIEWGGGYGSMARIMRKINPHVTYIIIDLPELLALQYIYLGSLEGEDNLHVVNPQDTSGIEHGKINLLASQMSRYYNETKGLKCDAFISTLALNESPPSEQKYVGEHTFFGARNLLLTGEINKDYFFANGIPEKLKQIPMDKADYATAEYWFW